MITFKQYLNERTSNTNLVKILEADCGPFLQAIKGNSRGFLYRGIAINTTVAGVFKEIELSDDPDDGTVFYDYRKSHPARAPKGSSTELHTAWDDYFYNKFGWKARSNHTFFATGDRHTAMNYGLATIIFPIGEFKFLWSPHVQDLWSDVISADPKDMDLLRYKMDDFHAAIESKNEIMIGCKSAYIVSVNTSKKTARLAELLGIGHENI